jgi:hypothetical protein
MLASMAQSALMKKEVIAPVIVKLVSLALINLLESTVNTSRQPFVLRMIKIPLVATALPFVSMTENVRLLPLMPTKVTPDVLVQMHGLGEYEYELVLYML